MCACLAMGKACLLKPEVHPRQKLGKEYSSKKYKIRSKIIQEQKI
jgi:hypothetical protein